MTIAKKMTKKIMITTKKISKKMTKKIMMIAKKMMMTTKKMSKKITKKVIRKMDHKTSISEEKKFAMRRTKKKFVTRKIKYMYPKSTDCEGTIVKIFRKETSPVREEIRNSWSWL